MGMHIRLAGIVAVRGTDGADRFLTSRRARAAFARLTLERNAGTPPDALADTVWPTRLPETWESALRTVVSRVRAFMASGLGGTPDALLFQGGRYLVHLPEDVHVDVEQAEMSIARARDALAVGSFAEAYDQARQGVDCLRLPLLSDQDGEWLTRRREHLAGVLITGLETASQAALAQGDAASALAYANETIGLAPFRESAHRHRMTAHAVAGNRAEALRAYEELRLLLVAELGTVPSPESEAVYCDLLGLGASSRSVRR